MSETKHTPGPWKVVDVPSRALEVHMPEPYQDTPVCSMRWTDGLDPMVNATKLADAHLIAAAPDLLAACEELIDAWSASAVTASDRLILAVDGVETTIAKAKP